VARKKKSQTPGKRYSLAENDMRSGQKRESRISRGNDGSVHGRLAVHGVSAVPAGCDRHAAVRPGAGYLLPGGFSARIACHGEQTRRLEAHCPGM